MKPTDLKLVLDHTKHIWEEFRDRRIFLTGGTGAIGQWIVEGFLHANRTLSLNATITILTRHVSGAPAHFLNHPSIQFCYGSLSQFMFPQGKFSHVIHAAYTDNLEEQLIGASRVRAFAEKNQAHLLYLSSGIVSKTNIPDNQKLYSRIKTIEENYFLCEARTIPIKIARLYTFAGPTLFENKKLSLSKFITDALTSGVVHLDGEGKSIRSYLYLSDLVIWLFSILCRGAVGISYDVGSDQPISIANVAHFISEYFHTHVEQSPLAIQPTHYLPDLSYAKELGLEIYTPFEQAISKTCDSVIEERLHAKRVENHGNFRSKTWNPV